MTSLIFPNKETFNAILFILLGGGLILVGALAWNTFLEALFDTIFLHDTGLVSEFVYSVTITVIIVIFIYWMSKVLSQPLNLIYSPISAFRR